MNVQTEYHKGETVGYHGHRAVVFDVNGQDVRILYHEDLPARHCHHCNGEGWISLGIWRSSVRSQSCDDCRGTGELPPKRVARDEWVSVDDLGVAPASVEREDAAEVGAHLSNPRGIFES